MRLFFDAGMSPWLSFFIPTLLPCLTITISLVFGCSMISDELVGSNNWTLLVDVGVASGVGSVFCCLILKNAIIFSKVMCLSELASSDASAGMPSA